MRFRVGGAGNGDVAPPKCGVVLKSMRVWEDGKYGSHEVMVGAFAAHCEP